MRLRREILFILMGMLVVSSGASFAAQTYNKQWDGAVITGSIPDSRFRYYLEPQIRFIDAADVFNQFLFLGGLGYPLSPDLMFFAGPGWILSKSTQGVTTNEIRFWQQLSWNVIRSNAFTLDSRTRLEERINTHSSQIAWRFRQRLWVRLPFKNFPTYSLSCFDEAFFNLNHPDWTSPYFFEQNRAFVGIGKQLYSHVMMDAGYLNQYLRSNQTQIDNVLLVLFTINL